MTGQPRTIYVAGPLFSEQERRYNREVAAFLSALGHRVMLPQDVSPTFDEMLASGLDPPLALKRVFEEDMAMLRGCDLLLFILDGRVPDEGACFELGWAYAQGMDVIGLKTDSRSSIEGMDNAMIAVPLEGRTAHDLKTLAEMVSAVSDK